MLLGLNLKRERYSFVKIRLRKVHMKKMLGVASVVLMASPVTFASVPVPASADAPLTTKEQEVDKQNLMVASIFDPNCSDYTYSSLISHCYN